MNKKILKGKVLTKRFFKRNGLTILTVIGIVGIIETVVMAVKATPEAVLILEKKREEKGEDLTIVECIKSCALTYVPTAIIGISTIACLSEASILNKNINTSLISSCSLIGNSFNEYKNKLKELYGEEADRKIVDSIVIEKAEDIHIWASDICKSNTLTPDDTSLGTELLFYDEFNNRYFISTMEKVMAAEYHFNRNYVLAGSIYLSDLYEFLGLNHTYRDSVIGWFSENEIYWIDFNHRKIELPDGKECYVIEMPFSPSEYHEENY